MGPNMDPKGPFSSPCYFVPCFYVKSIQNTNCVIFFLQLEYMDWFLKIICYYDPFFQQKTQNDPFLGPHLSGFLLYIN